MRAYNEAEAARLLGSLHTNFLEAALNTVVARHEMLRTLIQVHDGRPVQVVQERWRIGIALIDLTSLAPEERESEVKRLLVEEPRRPFDLALAPGIRAVLVRCGPEDHVFILTMHHMVCDGWSLPILYRELTAAYRAMCRGESLDLGPVPLHYPDFAAWKRRQVEEGTYTKELAFWTDYLRGAAQPRSNCRRKARGPSGLLTREKNASIPSARMSPRASTASAVGKRSASSRC